MAKILFVDDEPSIVHYMALSLDGAGHQTTTAATAEEAVTALRAEEFDLLICDLMMPGMGGMGLLAHTDGQTIPTIVVTGAVGSDESEQTLRNLTARPATMVIRKPFRPRDLVAAVERFLAGEVSAT